MIPRALLGLLLAAAVVALWVVNCSGPEPTIAEVRVREPRQDGDPYRVEALIRNDGHGHGQVEVVFRLRNRATGETVEAERPATLEAGERSLISTELWAPPADYEPSVEVEYPPG